MSFGYAENLVVTGTTTLDGLVTTQSTIAVAPTSTSVVISDFAESAGNVVTLTVVANPYHIGDMVFLSGLITTNGSTLNFSTVALIAPTNATTMTFNDPFTQGAQAFGAETGTATGTGTLGPAIVVTGDILGNDIANFFANGGISPVLLVAPNGELVGASGAYLGLDVGGPAGGFILADDTGSVNIQGAANNFNGTFNSIAFHTSGTSRLLFTNETAGSPLVDTSLGTLTGMNSINFSNSGGTQNTLVDCVSVDSTTISILAVNTNGGIFTYSMILTADFTAQTVTLGPSTLFTVPATAAAQGMYRYSYSLATNGTGMGSATLTIGWTDDVGARTTTAAILPLTAGGTTQGDIPIYATNTTNITYTVTSTAAGGASWNLRQRLEFLG